MKVFKLDNKKALVFGKGKFTDIILQSFIEAGAKPSLITWGNDFAEENRKKFGITCIPVNPLSEQEVNSSIYRVLEKEGQIDILVNETVFELYHPFTEMGLDEWEKGMRLNITPPFLSIRDVGKHFLERKQGRVINLVSALGTRGASGAVAFSTFMGAIIQMTRALAVEWSRQGIRVNAIGPGWFEGDLKDEALLKLIPLRRLGKLWEIGPLIIYLSADLSDFVTGQVFFVEGGILVRP